MMRKSAHTILAVALLAPLLLYGSGTNRRHPAYDQMVEAARRMKIAMRSLYFHKMANGLEVDSLDPNHTGLIGVEYSTITSTPGYLKAKRSVANPDFAAYVVRELVDHGITSDDTVLVTMTGSMPGGNLAVLLALETLGIPSVRIASLGASSYGANQEHFTWLDMEDVLYLEHKLEHRSDYVTLGATGDVGGGLPEGGKWSLRHTAERLGYDVVESKSLRRQSRLRRQLRGSPEKYSLLINIGGNHAMLGKGPEGRELPGGWNDPRDLKSEFSDTDDLNGIMFNFLQDGIPVLNILHIEDIAKSAGIPFDPQPLPKIGESPVYYVDPDSITP
jgi:poly-gamma-glutamate system protein